jgi:peptidyl-prolyl cis-trans isomerase D
MLKSIQERDLDRNRWIKITMAVVLGIICLSMVVTMVPGLMTGTLSAGSPDAIASVGGQDISLLDAQQEYNLQTRSQTIPAMLRPIYAKQIADQMIFEGALRLQADRMGITITPQEIRSRIKQVLPMSFSGDTWLKDRYPSDVQNNLGMSVQEFEQAVSSSILQEKFREMVVSGISVSEGEIRQEFRARNEKVQIQYVLIKPADLATTVHPSDADLAGYFAKNSSKYQVLEKRSARYALLDLAKLKATTQVTDDDLRAFYNANIDQYKVENRVHLERILFKTAAKTDAEIAEIKQKASGVLKQAKSGTNFEDLAKKNSEDDATKDKGGDLGWIVQGQTVPQIEQVAFSLPKGGVSDLIQTEYGIEIIKSLDHETAHTKTLDEVKDTILPQVLDNKVNAEASSISEQMAAAIRQSDRQPIEDVAKKFNLELGETAPAPFSASVGDLGDSADIHRLLFELRTGELGQPTQIDKGFVILTPKDIQPAHQGTLAEVHDQVLSDYQHQQSVTLAQSRANDLAKSATSGAAMDKAAKDLGLQAKTSDFFARSGTIPDVGTGKQVTGAFAMDVGQISAPINLSGNWLVFRVVARNTPNPDDLAAQHADIQQQLLQTKQDAAYQAFRTSLEDQLTKEGKLILHPDVMKQFTGSST